MIKKEKKPKVIGLMKSRLQVLLFLLEEGKDLTRVQVAEKMDIRVSSANTYLCDLDRIGYVVRRFERKHPTVIVDGVQQFERVSVYSASKFAKRHITEIQLDSTYMTKAELLKKLELEKLVLSQERIAVVAKTDMAPASCKRESERGTAKVMQSTPNSVFDLARALISISIR